MMLIRATLLSAAALVISGCATAPTPGVGSSKISYGDARAVETVSIEYGSTDLQMTAEKMARSLAQSGVLQGRPLIQVYDVMNKTSEYIDTREITNSIKVQITKSGVARFTNDDNQLQNQVDQLRTQNQSGLYKSSTVARMGNMIAAKYRLEGSVSSIVKRTEDYKDVYYKFTLQLIDVETGIAEWIDEQEIRKGMER